MEGFVAPDFLRLSTVVAETWHEFSMDPETGEHRFLPAATRDNPM